MTEVLLKIIESMIAHFWIITLSLIGSSLLKKILYMWIELRKLEIQNKNIFEIEIETQTERKILKIQSSDLKLEQLKKSDLIRIEDFKKTS